MSAENEVRAVWKQFKESVYDPHEGYSIPQHKIDIGIKTFIEIKRSDALQAALDFTRERKQEIAEIEEEIELMHLLHGNWGWQAWHPVMQRTLSRLTAQRDELKRGMKV